MVTGERILRTGWTVCLTSAVAWGAHVGAGEVPTYSSGVVAIIMTAVIAVWWTSTQPHLAATCATAMVTQVVQHAVFRTQSNPVPRTWGYVAPSDLSQHHSPLSVTNTGWHLPHHTMIIAHLIGALICAVLLHSNEIVLTWVAQAIQSWWAVISRFTVRLTIAPPLALPTPAAWANPTGWLSRIDHAAISRRGPPHRWMRKLRLASA